MIAQGPRKQGKQVSTCEAGTNDRPANIVHGSTPQGSRRRSPTLRAGDQATCLRIPINLAPSHVICFVINSSSSSKFFHPQPLDQMLPTRIPTSTRPTPKIPTRNSTVSTSNSDNVTRQTSILQWCSRRQVPGVVCVVFEGMRTRVNWRSGRVFHFEYWAVG